METLGSSRKNFRTDHFGSFQGVPRREYSPKREKYPIWDELDLWLDLEEYRQSFSPFIPDIENYPLPTMFKILSMRPYDATTDSEDHLFAFLTHRHLQIIGCSLVQNFPNVHGRKGTPVVLRVAS